MPIKLPTPQELFDLYTKGFKGAYCDKEDLKKLMGELRHPMFGIAADDLVGSGEGKLSRPYLSVLKFDPKSYTEAQVTGDCLLNVNVVMANGLTKNISDISTGEYVLAADGSPALVVSVLKKHYAGKIIRIAHGHASVEATPDHRFSTVCEDGKYRWFKAADLKVDDVVECFGEILNIDEISERDYSGDVYCIGVDYDHSFCAMSESATHRDFAFAVSNCVSHGTRNAVDISRAVEIDLRGEAEEWIARGATEGIYGSRGHGGQGMSCSGAARFVTSTGGLLVRQKYDFADLSEYKNSVKLGMGWGSRGVPSDVAKEAKKHQVTTASMIKTVAEARDALANGYGIAVCSNFGFSSKRNEFGIASKQGNWNHCMCISACDDRSNIRSKYDGSLFLIQNSWGCHSDDTEVLTEKGWLLFKDVDIQTNKIATLNPNNHELEYHFATEKFEYDVNTFLYQYKFRGVDQLVTGGHNMYYGKLHSDTKDPASWSFSSAETMPKYFHIKKDCKWNRPNVATHTVGKHVVDMDLWLEFLGYFLSEGHTCETKHKIKSGTKVYGVTGISQEKIENVSKIQSLLNKLPFKFAPHDGSGWTTYNKSLFAECFPFGKCDVKYIPDYVWNCSSRQLEILYQALMLGDGSVSIGPTGPKRSYYTSSKKLADDFQVLCLLTNRAGDINFTDRVGQIDSRGYRYNHIEYVVKIKEVSLTPREGKGSTKLLLPYSGKVYCFTVPNHIMYVRRNGVASWSGNSFNSGGHPDWGPIPPGSFLITSSNMQGMLNQNGTFAFSNVNGFPLRELPNYGTSNYI